MSPVETHEPGEGSTPELVAAYWGGHDATEVTLHKVRRRTFVIALVSAVFICVAVGVFLVKVYGTVSDIRTTQVHNTSVTHCQDRAFTAVLKDAKLAISGDHDAADYAVAPKC